MNPPAGSTGPVSLLFPGPNGQLKDHQHAYIRQYTWSDEQWVAMVIASSTYQASDGASEAHDAYMYQ